jgi:imidazolonepropionase-like amidohydrolase
MFVAGNYVSSTGGAGDARQFSIFVDVPVVKNLADGPEEVTKAVRTNFKHGADFIKILATGAVLSVGISPGAQQYSDAEIQAAVTEARRWGRQVAAHAHGASGIKAAIRAGVRTVDHGSYLDDEAISLLKANPTTYYVPTLYLTEVVEDETLSPHVPASEKARAHQIRDVMYAGFKRALAAGIPIGLGTDSAVIPHGRNARELATRVRLGESPMAALVAATRVNAEILGWSDRVGTVEAGKWADIIAAPGDPLRDISVLDRVSFVSIQRELRDADGETLVRAPRLTHVGGELDDFDDTAAVVSLVDLVISVDTSVVHLAAALGRPTWILLPFWPDWRWMLDRADSPWYPTARLFRQSAPGGWDSVIARVTEEALKVNPPPPRANG